MDDYYYDYEDYSSNTNTGNPNPMKMNYLQRLNTRGMNPWQRFSGVSQAPSGYVQRQQTGMRDPWRRMTSNGYEGGGGGYRIGISAGQAALPDSGYLEAPIQQSGYGPMPNHQKDLNLLQPPPKLPSIEERLGLDGLLEIDFLTLIILLGAVGAGAVFFLYQAIVDNGRRGTRRRGLDTLHHFVSKGEEYCTNIVNDTF